MKYGLIGNPLGHSWSPEIHQLLAGIPYEKKVLQEEELHDFFAKRDFQGINVTIPYKEAVIPYLDEIDDSAKEIGAINCIVNEGGKLKGYNTDCSGCRKMLESNGIDPCGKRVAILGSGGAAKAVVVAIRQMKGIPVIVSRHPDETMISYEELYARASEFQMIVNATPVGMKPDCDKCPVDIAVFEHLEAVVDIVANPLMTRLLFTARMRGIPCCGGFEMLVRQAAEADVLFTGTAVDEETIDRCMRKLLCARRNIVLIGMPTSGKTTLAEMIASHTGRPLLEMDEVLVDRLGMSIKECFAQYGESYFRKMETELAKDLRYKEGIVISTGGGIIKNEENMRYLHENGIVIAIDRDPSLLYPTDSRPLSSNEEAVRALYEERKYLYQKYSDIVVDNNGSLQDTFDEIMKITGEE